MTKPMTIEEARAAGFLIDTQSYPLLAYRGPRFRPTVMVELLTEREKELAEALENLTRAVSEGWELTSDNLDALEEARRVLASIGREP